MKFKSIITYKDNYQDYVSALFFESSGSDYVIMHKGTDPAGTVRTVTGRYTDDPWMFAEKVTPDASNTPTDAV
jgi:hypothetical protein